MSLSTIVVLACANCGTPIRKPARLIRQLNYCSRQCCNTHRATFQRGPGHHNYQKVDVPCANCGKVRKFAPSAVKRARNVFCGKACYSEWQTNHQVGAGHPQWKGGKLRNYGPNWLSQRRAARERDAYRCQHCGVSEKKLGHELNVHHITPFRTFGLARYLEANDLANLICFCYTCHNRAEHGLILVQPKLL